MLNKIWVSPFGISEGLYLHTREGEIADWQGEEMESGDSDRREAEERVEHEENNYINSFSN